MRRALGGVLAALVPLALGAGADASPQQAAPAKGRWTFLYYVDGDNNLESDLLDDMTRMAAANVSGDVKVLALVDRTPDDTSYTSEGVLVPDANLGSIPKFDDAKLVEIVGGDFKVVQEVGEIDMGDVQTWSWFLTAGMRMAPAEHYAAVVLNHGGGIDGASWDDASNKSNLTMDDLASGLQAALQAAGEDTIDVMGFSACLMAHFDMAAKLAPYAKYLVASEEVTISRQWDDTAFIRAAIDNPKATGPELGQAVVAAMERTADDYPERTMATIDLSRMGSVTQAVTSLGLALKKAITESAAPLGRAQTQTLHFGLKPDQPDAYALYDIGDLVADLQGMPAEVTTAANALWEAERLAVVNKGSGSAAQAMTGMSIYLPSKGEEHSAEYTAQAAVREWADALTAYTGGPKAGDGGGGAGAGAAAAVRRAPRRSSSPSPWRSGRTACTRWGSCTRRPRTASRGRRCSAGGSSPTGTPTTWWSRRPASTARPLWAAGTTGTRRSPTACAR